MSFIFPRLKLEATRMWVWSAKKALKSSEPPTPKPKAMSANSIIPRNWTSLWTGLVLLIFHTMPTIQGNTFTIPFSVASFSTCFNNLGGSIFSHARRIRNTPRFYPVTKDPGEFKEGVPRKRKTRHSRNPPVENHVGWILDSRDHTTGRRPSISEQSIAESVGSRYVEVNFHDFATFCFKWACSSFLSCGTPSSLPAFHHPSHSLLKENGFTQLEYSKYHSRCLKGKKVLSFNLVVIFHRTFRHLDSWFIRSRYCFLQGW